MSKQAKRARKFLRQIKSGDPAPIYYIYGEETYLLDKALEAITKAACPEGTNDFNYDSFQGTDIDGDAVLAAAEMLPMMAERRLVVVRDLQEVALSELDPLEPYFEDPSPTTCLVFHARTINKSIDGRKRMVKKLKKAAEHCEFEPLYENELGPFLKRQANKRGLRLRREASAYLVDAVGTELAALDQALQKVDLYLGESDSDGPREVTVDDASAIVARTRNRSVFDLTDALGERDYQTAMEVLDRMLLDGEAPLVISHMIARHYRIVARLQDPKLRSASNKKAASTIHVPPFFVDDYRRHARIFSPAKVELILKMMLEVDIALKSSPLPDRVILERLLTDICFESVDEAG